MTQIARLSPRSEGEFDFNCWIEEGDGLLASSREARKIWHERQSELSTSISPDQGKNWSLISQSASLQRGLPRSSMLLLGYAVEMYLKAAIVKVYRGCSEEMFSRDVKKRFGHDFNTIAKEIEFPERQSYEQNFKTLKNMVLVDARYPLSVSKNEKYTDAVNGQTHRMWSKDTYASLTELAERVKRHAMNIDSNKANPAEFYSINIDQDGYLAFRVGGGLSPRITYRLSTALKDRNETTPSHVKALFDNFEHGRILHYWDHARILEDGKNDKGNPKTLVKKKLNAP